MADRPLPAYEGEEPYVFVSYSHEDEKAVYPEIRWLQDQGFNIWYDEGISGASRWRDAIASRLSDCHLLLYFVSPRSVESPVCREELEYILDLGRPVLSVHLEDTDLPDGIRLAIANRQALFRHELGPEDYERKLVAAVATYLEKSIPTMTQSRAARTQRQSRGSLWVLASVLVVAGLVFGWMQWGDSSDPTYNQVLRYSIPQPANGMTFTFAISPDGRHVAFQSVVGNGGTQIYLRALDSWETKALPGTENATNMFWSPDSQRLGFFVPEELRVVGTSGEPSDLICKVPGLLGASGTWGVNDTIIFASSTKNAPGPLLKVPASGGEPQVLTTVEQGESHRFPTFIDEDHFLFTSMGGTRSGIFVANQVNPEPRRVLADASSAQVSVGPSNRAQLLFVRDGKVMAQRFDLDSFEVVADPVVILESAPYTDQRRAAISVSDTGTLAYLSGSNREVDSQFAWLSRAGEILDEVDRSEGPSPVSLSPDGETMAILRNSVDDPYFSDLWLRDVDRESEIRKTFDGRIDEAGNVVWSPGGDKVVFTADPQKTGNLDLYWMDVLSVSPPSLLLESEHPLYASDWSYNGEYLVYSEYHPDRQADLWYVPIPNGKVGEPVPFLQTDYIESAGQLSPDGRWIAYVSNDTGSNAVYVRQFPSGAGVWKISGSAASTQPRWSPSGDELFFLEGVSPNVRVMTSRVSDEVLARGETPFEPATLLFGSTINSFHPATGTSFYTVTPDGQSFIVNHLRTDREPVVNFVTNWRNAFEVPAD